MTLALALLAVSAMHGLTDTKGQKKKFFFIPAGQ
jgi:hypothetical protein